MCCCLDGLNLELFVFDKKGNRIKCKICGEYLRKDPHCNGDYYPVEAGIILMSYCPNCGLMRPNVKDSDMIFGVNKKKQMARKTSLTFKLGFKETQEKALSIKSTVPREVINTFSEEVNLPPEVIIRTLIY